MVAKKKKSKISNISLIIATISITISLFVLSEQFEYQKLLKNYIKSPNLSCPVIINISSVCNFDGTEVIDKNKLKVYTSCDEDLYVYDFSDPRIEEIRPVIRKGNKSLSRVVIDVNYNDCSLKEQ